ncbi:MAG TPA: PIN domain-containing protein [Conexibacter sp.]|nr:PIN domain-containing protein [Conexibacter sp.]
MAEIENGRLKKNWGSRLWVEADRRLANCPRLTIGERTAHVCALIEDAERRRGRSFSENDLWIAATAQTLGVPIVTCDKAFLRMDSLDVEVVYLPSQVPAEVTGAR